MGRDKIKDLRKGAIIKHRDKDGTVIDWGNVINLKRIFGRGDKKLMLPNMKIADSVRVRTNEGNIEIWPTEEVELSVNR